MTDTRILNVTLRELAQVPPGQRRSLEQIAATAGLPNPERYEVLVQLDRLGYVEAKFLPNHTGAGGGNVVFERLTPRGHEQARSL